MALARRVRGGSKRESTAEQLEQALEEREPEQERSVAASDDGLEAGESPRAEAHRETQRGALLILGLGCTFVVMGLGLVVGRQLGYTGRVDALTDIGLSPGGFVFTGLVLSACSLVLRSLTALVHHLDDLDAHQGARVKRALHLATAGALPEETQQLWAGMDESLRTLLACREGEREESSRSATFIRDAEIKIDTIKRTLEETHRRVLEVHHQVGEGLGDTSVADLAPQLRESLERLLAERTHALAQEFRTQSEKAGARQQERLDALAAQIEKSVPKAGKAESAVLEALRTELERTRGELGQSIEKLAGKSGETPQVGELKQDLREVLRRCEQIERELRSAPRASATAAPATEPPTAGPAAALAAALAASATAAAPATAAATAASEAAGEAGGTGAIASAIARLRQMKG